MRPLRLGALLTLALGPLAACGDDASPATTADTSDTANEVDNDTVDTPETDVDPGPPGPRAFVWPVAPGVSEAVEEVTLRHLPEDYSVLSGPFARVRSCTPDLERGKRSTFEFGDQSMEVVSCVPEARALPGDDGTYRHITPPATPAEDDGRFAEVMMYHHMQVIHDYYKDLYGLTERDHPLEALTNVQTWTDYCDGWSGIANAAYVPYEALNYFVTGLDFGGIGGDAIVFSGTADKNFSFDASVIYHEYTHAILGATRLNATFIDAQGINNLPGALNEAYADYFAATQTGEPLVGGYALNDLAAADYCGIVDTEEPTENYARDLTATRRCPDDLVAEVHVDSEVFSAALWAIREEFGKYEADNIIMYAVTQLVQTSDFDSAAATTIQAALEVYGESARARVEAIFAERNLVRCDRAIPIEKVGLRGIPLRHEGTRNFDPNPFPGWVPGYLQYKVEVPANTRIVTLTLDARAGFGGQSPLEMEAAFKHGGDPIYYTSNLGAGRGRHDSNLIVPVNETKQVVLEAGEGQALTPGTWVFALHNKGRRTVRVSGITAAFE